MNDRIRIWQNYYDQCAAMDGAVFQSARFDIAPFQFDAIIADIRRKLPLNDSDTLLDVGCSTGQIDRALAPHCGRLIGVDLSEESLRVARELHRNFPHAEFRWADASDLPFADDSIDKVLMYGVSMHGDLDSMRQVIAEFVRVTRDRGRILIGDNISPTLWQRYLANKGLRRAIGAYATLNPEGEFLILPRVIAYHLRKIVAMRWRRWRIPEIRHTLDPVDEPTENSAFETGELLEAVAATGQTGRILGQNYRLPYARFRYDLIIDVRKPGSATETTDSHRQP